MENGILVYIKNIVRAPIVRAPKRAWVLRLKLSKDHKNRKIIKNELLGLTRETGNK